MRFNERFELILYSINGVTKPRNGIVITISNAQKWQRCAAE